MMVNVGPVGPITCPNETVCPHDLEQHRYESDRDRWVCVVDDCPENPYRVIKVNDGGWPLSAEGYTRRLETLRAANPEATIEFEEDRPRAVVQRQGCWIYLVAVDHGLLRYGPDGYGWHVLGRRRAERKAAKVLARYIRKQAREAEITRVEAP